MVVGGGVKSFSLSLYNRNIEGSDKQLLEGDGGRDIEESNREGKIQLALRGEGLGQGVRLGEAGQKNRDQSEKLKGLKSLGRK